jgi:hypothetical protein
MLSGVSYWYFPRETNLSSYYLCSSQPHWWYFAPLEWERELL